ncbi:MAG: GGDEF domain-containing protein [Firmicutes bacterium]|nr:GGDEF domain-containing protein [Bacillota bacterium]
MILQRRLRTICVLYFVLLGLAIWQGGRLLAWDYRARLVGIFLAYTAGGGLWALTEIFFIRPLRRRLLRLGDLVRMMDPGPPPPRIRGADELETLRADLRRVMRRFEETRGDLAVQRIRAEVDSRTDPLTKLYNHRSFARFLGEEWEKARRLRAPLALIFIDIDHFKNINDTLGHLVGNEVLERVAGLIKEVIRGTDLVFRYAGDEFAVLLPRTGLEQAVNLAERLRLRVHAQRLETPEGPRALSLSIGVAELGAQMKEPEDLVEMADRALYRAKEAGRNCVAYPVAQGGFRLCGREEED